MEPEPRREAALRDEKRRRRASIDGRPTPEHSESVATYRPVCQGRANRGTRGVEEEDIGDEPPSTLAKRRVKGRGVEGRQVMQSDVISREKLTRSVLLFLRSLNFC